MSHDKTKAAARKRKAETGEPYTAARRAVQIPPAGAGYALAMSGEIHDWLSELRGSDPPAALRVMRSLVTLMDKGAGLGDPLVASAADSWPWALMQALDRSDRERQDRLAAARRGVAAAATLIKDIQDQVATLEGTQAAQVRLLLLRMIEARERLGQVTQRLRARAEASKVRTEVLKASYVAAAGSLRARAAIAALDLDDDSQAAGARLAEVTAQMERELGQQGGPAGLMELRPGAPLRSDIRILFAVEPPGTALLIAVLHGLEAVEDQFPEAVMASADMLRRIRAGQAPEAVAHTYRNTRSFMLEFYFGASK